MSAVEENKSLLQKLDAVLNEKNIITDQLAKLEEKTKVNRRYLVLAGSLVIGLYLLIGYAAGLVCSVIGFLYPAYKSIKAIESAEKDDDTKWLTYWVVYGIFSLVEFFADIFIFWIPFYWLAKCGFLVWCMLPWNNGSIFLYRRFIRPFILRYKDDIDQAAARATDAMKDAMSKGEKMAAEAVVDSVTHGKSD